MRVLLLRGRSTYGAIDLFIDDLAKAVRQAGGEAQVVALTDPANVLEPLAAAVADGSGQPFDLVFSIGLFGEARDARGRSVAEIVRAPHVVQYVDYPLSHHVRLRSTPAETAILVIDPSHVDAIRSVFGPDRFRHVAFSPHGALGADLPEPPPMAQRDIPVLFPATFYKPGPLLWRNLSPEVRRIFDAAVEMALQEEFLPALTALNRALELHGAAVPEGHRRQLPLNAFAVHEHVRAHRRYEMLRAAAKARLPLHVFGHGYQKDLDRFKNVTYGGDADLQDVLLAMRRSRMVLNVNANFGCGSHERPLSAMVAGAVAVMDHSAFYDANFAPGDLVQLRWRRLDEDLDELRRRLDDPDGLTATAAAGHLRARQGHLWAHRLPAILAAADAVRG